MKKFFLHILLVGVLGMLAVSCSDEFDSLGLESNKAQVMFSIAMDTPAARSRANTDAWGDKYTPSAPGDKYDNHIDINQFVVKMTDGDGNEYPISDIVKWQLKDDENKEIPNEYEFVGIVEGITQKTTLENVKIQIYANMGNNEDADFENMTFQQNAANIPMWGVKTIESLDLTPGTRVKAGDIFLLRAMAKFEVSISDALEAKGYKLTDVKLNKFNRKGNFMPKGYATVSETTTLDQETVLNENYTVQDQNVSLPALEENKKYVVYLPEISNTTESELKMLLTFKKGKDEFIETEVVVKDYTADNTGLINIVRNHWYKYVIEDIVNGQPEVHYDVVQWVTKNIEVGGAGFLGLSTDLVEVFSANTGTLKFVSSSPIVEVVLADIYKHENNGTFTEGTADGVKAYYITKFGQKTELGQDPGFTITNLETVLEREAQILNYIDNHITWSENMNEGTITVDSPYMKHKDFAVESHNDTPRYLEFLVTNQQGLTATFRMMQYPPVVITNVEGFFSYRDDYVPEAENIYHNREAYPDELKFDGPAHYLNYYNPAFFVNGFFPAHVHESNGKGSILLNGTGPVPSCAESRKEEVFEECQYAEWDRVWMRTFEPVNGLFHRDWYKGLSYGEVGSSNYYQALGNEYYDEENKKYYRRHYRANLFEVFWSKCVMKVYKEKDVDIITGKTTNSKGEIRSKGQADIGELRPDPDSDFTDWCFWKGEEVGLNNHRMYHFRITSVSDKYVIGYPQMEDGNVLMPNKYDKYRDVTKQTASNARLVSPSFMVASQLGESYIPNDEYDIVVPKGESLYYYAKRQCQEYVETYYKDNDNNGEYTSGKDEVIHYHDWRLPTQAEINLILEYQKNSRVVDELLTGQYYYCASSTQDGKFNVLSQENIDYKKTGVYMRCVRDVKPGHNGEGKIY